MNLALTGALGIARLRPTIPRGAERLFCSFQSADVAHIATRRVVSA